MFGVHDPAAVFLTFGSDLLELFGLIFESRTTDMDGPTRGVADQPPLHNRVRRDQSRLLERRNKRCRVTMANGKLFGVSSGHSMIFDRAEW